MKLKKCFNAKKIIKWFGRLLSILAVLFVAKTIWNLDINYANLVTVKMLFGIGLCVVFQTTLIFVACQSWINYLKLTSGIAFSWNEIWGIYTKANLYKYLPGNVFQYIGRNELAVNNEITHKQVAGSTVLDTITMVLVKMCVSFICLRSLVVDILYKYTGQHFFPWVILFIIPVLVLIVILIGKIELLRNAFTEIRKNISLVVYSFSAYIVVDIISGIMYVFVISFLLETTFDFHITLLLVGGYTLASVIGFLVPGVPGGIGIREAIIIFLANELISTEVITTAAVLMRIICILADILAFAIAYLYVKRKSKCRF